MFSISLVALGAGLVLVAFVGGVGLLVGLDARRRRRADDHAIPIGGGRFRYVTDADGRADFRPELREATLARRTSEDAARKHANRVASGASAPLEVVKRRGQL